MTPAKTAAILRRYNEWRRGDERLPWPIGTEIGKAIDAAVEMIERLEAAEKDVAMKEEVIDSLAAVVKRLDAQCDAAEKERDDLRAKVERMEKQEPVGTLHDDGCFVWRETAPHQSSYAGWKMVLYTLPGAQPAPSVPDGWKLMPIEPTQEIRDAWTSHMHESFRVAYQAMLDVVPEAKP